MVDHVGVPESFEDHIGETQGEQVLDGFLAEEMIDTVGLVFGEDSADLFDDFACRGEVVPDRFFQHHAGLFGNQFMGLEIVAHRAVEAG